jgi:hypothetical protein
MYTLLCFVESDARLLIHICTRTRIHTQYAVTFNFNSGDESKVVAFGFANQFDNATHVKANANTNGALQVRECVCV